MLSRASQLLPLAGAGIAFLLVTTLTTAAEVSGAQVQALIEQNRRLQEQVRVQQSRIEELTAKVSDVVQLSERHERALRTLDDRAGAAPAPAVSRREGEMRISAEAGLAFFKTSSQGQYPFSAFRIDDAVLSFEAPIRKNTYFFTELRLLPRETNEETFELGEIYVDFENVSAAWGQPGLLNLRVGRLNIPFGEEYLNRGVMANPLISHSLSDFWGVDEGIEAYGRIGPAQYVIAVQNGGVSRLRDFHSDKSVTARVSWQPTRWLSLSGSAMRTGKISTADNLTELWFGNAFFRSIGPTARTPDFWVNLMQLDSTVRWKTGRLGLSIGQAHYNDSDPLADNSRTLKFGHVEGVQTITGALFGAVRHSEITVDRGYPLAGWAPMGAFFFRPVLTEELRRTSVGLGYRFGDPLVLKVEYTWENGRTTTGLRRDKENFFGTELGMKF